MSSDVPFISEADVAAGLDWSGAINAIEQGCKGAPGQLSDMMFGVNAGAGRGEFLNRAASIDGIGLALKSVTIFPDNPKASPPRPTVHGALILFDDNTGAPKAIIDGGLVTKWKTAADSVLGAKYLARPDARRLLILGAGAVARSLVEAYAAAFPQLTAIEIWARDVAKAEKLAAHVPASGAKVTAVNDRVKAAAAADIITSATSAVDPVLLGEWVKPGTHVDLIGAFRPDMREADDALLHRSRICVDSRETTLDHIGELKIPLAEGVINRNDISGDLYDLAQGLKIRASPDDITLFKNGGGAHFDLMIADWICRRWDIDNSRP